MKYATLRPSLKSEGLFILVKKRFRLTDQIGLFKKHHQIPVEDLFYEVQQRLFLVSQLEEAKQPEVMSFFHHLSMRAKRRQREITERSGAFLLRSSLEDYRCDVRDIDKKIVDFFSQL